MKVFVKNEDGGKVLKKEDFDEKALTACTQEKDNLLKCYEFLNGKVHVVQNCGLYAVVMPIFKPIFQGDRDNKLKNVEAALKNMKEKTGKLYERCDVRWRHVGTFNEQVILFDLADLVDHNDQACDLDWSVTSDDESKEEDNKKEPGEDPVLKEYMKIFKRHCGNDDGCSTAPSYFGDVFQKNS